MSLVFNTWVETDGCGAMSLVLLDNMERLIPTAINTLPQISHTPYGGLCELVINGVTFTTVDGSFHVDTNRNVYWTSTEISVVPSDMVIAVYSYMGSPS
jgi:hypothetical protein